MRRALVAFVVATAALATANTVTINNENLLQKALSSTEALASENLLQKTLSSSEVDATPNTCDTQSVTAHFKSARQTIKAGWALDNWKHGPKKAQRNEVHNHVACLDKKNDRNKIQVLVRRAERTLDRYSGLRRVTNYHCGGGRWDWFVIECYILDCESYGGSWSATNGSHVGPYSLSLSLYGPPWPVSGWADKMEHHRIAARLWSGPGDSDWAACV